MALIRVLTAFLYIFDSIAYFFIKKASNVQPCGLALVKLDNVGDWLLFSDCFNEFIRRSGCKNIDLYVNQQCINFIPHKDGLCITPIDVKKYQLNIFYRVMLNRRFVNRNYETVFCPTHSRVVRTSDTVVRFLQAEKKIGVESNSSNATHYEISFSDRWYDSLISVNRNCYHELDKNYFLMSVYFGSILDQRLVDLEGFSDTIDLPEGSYAVIFISTSSAFRNWDVSNYMEVALHLLARGVAVVFCGTSKDSSILADNFADLMSAQNVYNKTAATTLKQALYLVRKATLVVCGDTLAAHMAINSSVPLVAIAGLGMHERFLPYPKHYQCAANYIHSAPCENSGCAWKCRHALISNKFPCVSKVDARSVIDSINKILN